MEYVVIWPEPEFLLQSKEPKQDQFLIFTVQMSAVQEPEAVSFPCPTCADSFMKLFSKVIQVMHNI